MEYALDDLETGFEEVYKKFELLKKEIEEEN